jgi:hypothetical protein
MSGLPELTEKQKAALPNLIAEAAAHGLVIPGPWSFDVTFREESRPGRGHDVSLMYCDGDMIATGTVDVYGNGAGLGIGNVEWIHDLSEECECGPCQRERSDDD